GATAPWSAAREAGPRARRCGRNRGVAVRPHGPATAMLRTAPPARRAFLRWAAAMALAAPGRAIGQPRRFTIGFANVTDDPGARLEGLGFTGEDVRSSFVLGARGLPVDLVLYDNARERAKTIANA